MDQRKPAVAGSFYPKEAAKLREMVAGFVKNAEIGEKSAREAVSFVAPHAGYVYSGSTAGFAYKAISKRIKEYKPETFVIIGPNHTGNGDPLSLSGRAWTTPLGIVENDLDFTEAVSEFSDLFSIEEDAHAGEHSIEVQLPFLQEMVDKPSCVFLCMGDQSYESAVLISKAIQHAEKKLERKIIVIASSDFNHYESAAVAKKKDMPAIEELLKLDVRRFAELIEELQDTACGHGPMAAAASYAKSKGAKEGKLLRYSNSGDITKDYDSVVAYASMLFA